MIYLPREYNPIDSIKNPSELAVWVYENQDAQRFGADDLLFFVLLDKDNPARSWELKRSFALVFQEIDNFFDKETVSKKDEIVFTFDRKTYTAERYTQLRPKPENERRIKKLKS